MENALQINGTLEYDFEETCPYCDYANELKVSDAKDYKDGKKVIACQDCGAVILACNLCEHCGDGCGKCCFEDGNFINDAEKMRDFKILSKEEFLKSYSYLTEAEYDNTMKIYKQKGGTK